MELKRKRRRKDYSHFCHSFDNLLSSIATQCYCLQYSSSTDTINFCIYNKKSRKTSFLIALVKRMCAQILVQEFLLITKKYKIVVLEKIQSNLMKLFEIRKKKILSWSFHDFSFIKNLLFMKTLTREAW